MKRSVNIEVGVSAEGSLITKKSRTDDDTNNENKNDKRGIASLIVPLADCRNGNGTSTENSQLPESNDSVKKDSVDISNNNLRIKNNIFSDPPSIVQTSNERIQLLVKRIKQCGNDVQRCINFFKDDDEIILTNTTLRSSYQSVNYEDCYVAALQVCLNSSKKIQKKKAKKIRTTATQSITRIIKTGEPINDSTITNDSNKCKGDYNSNDNIPTNTEEEVHQERILIRDFVQQISDVYPTVSCYAKCISIYGLLGYYNYAMELYEQQLELLSKQQQQSTTLDNNDSYNDVENTTTCRSEKADSCNSSSSSIILLQSMLAACVPSGEWKIALNVLSSAITKSVSSHAVTTASCNIVLNAMCTAREGTRAYDILQIMIQSQQPEESSVTCTCNSDPAIDTSHRWPPPDKSSYLYVMNALISQQQAIHRIPKKSDGSVVVESFQYIDMAFSLLNPLMQQIRTSSNDVSTPVTTELQQTIQPHLHVLLNGYRQMKCNIMINYIITNLKNSNVYLEDSSNTTLPTPNEIRRTDSEHQKVYYSDKSDNKTSPRTDKVEEKSSTQEESPSLFVHWEDHSHGGGLIKHGRGRFAYWAYATYTDTLRTLIVALQPNTDPLKNGIKILLYDTTTSSTTTTSTTTIISNDEHKKPKFHKEKKVGYLLLRNASVDSPVELENDANIRQWHGTSTFLGMYIDPNYRKEKLSKVFLSIWLDLCLKANLEPVTGIINKPLLALILQDTFRFQPVGGFDVEIIPKEKNKSLTIDTTEDMIINESNLNHTNDESIIELYSPRASKTLIGGALPSSDLKRENIRLVPNNNEGGKNSSNESSTGIMTSKPNGRAFRLGCSFRLENNSVILSTSHPELDRSMVDMSSTTSLSPSSSLQELVTIHLKGHMGSGMLQYYNDNSQISGTMPWTKIMLGK